MTVVQNVKGLPGPKLKIISIISWYDDCFLMLTCVGNRKKKALKISLSPIWCILSTHLIQPTVPVLWEEISDIDKQLFAHKNGWRLIFC